MSLRDKILAVNDAKVVPLEIPEWNETVYIRVMSGAERDRLEAGNRPDKNGNINLVNLRGRFAVLVLSDANGARIFTDNDAVALGAKSSAALDRILEVGSRLNKITEETVKELEVKSESSQSVDSGTSSHSA